MAESRSSVQLAMPAAVAFDRLTAMRNHERLIPLTRIRTPSGRPTVGDVSVATSVLVLVDTMELVGYRPPAGDRSGRATWVKRGPVLLGEAEIVVTPIGADRSRVDWYERDIRLATLPPRLTRALLTASVGLMTRFALHRFARLSAPRDPDVQHGASDDAP